MKDALTKLGLHGSSHISIGRTRRNSVSLPTTTRTKLLTVVVLVAAAVVSAFVLRFGGFGAVRVRPIGDARIEHHAANVGPTGTNITHDGDVVPSSSHGSASSLPATTTIQGASQGSGREGAAAMAAAVFTVVPRAFVPYPHEFPCYPAGPDDQLLRRAWQDRAPATQGLLYEKPNKCASTTLAGVNLRMARNAAQRIRRLRQPTQVDIEPSNFTLCDVRWSHGGRLRAERYRYRNQSRSFLWSAVRDPTSRAVSWYHFKRLSLDLANHTDTEFRSFLLRQKDHFYLTFLDTRPYTVHTWIDAVAEINFVLGEYEFIGVTERLDESVVVLMLLLGAPMADVLYYSSKVHHGLFARAPGTPCYYLQPSVVSDEVREFFASDEWNNKIRSDAEFYRAVNASLDLTIEGLGRDRVEAELARFRRAQALVRERCQGRVRMPCERAGGTALPVEETDCMVGDVGCGMECLDRVATELGLWM